MINKALSMPNLFLLAMSAKTSGDLLIHLMAKE